MICKIFALICLIIISNTRASRKVGDQINDNIYNSCALQVARNALPREIFRDDVEPKRGGKVPEAARDPERIELNKQDADNRTATWNRHRWDDYNRDRLPGEQTARLEALPG